jgi:hypothetical protein
MSPGGIALLFALFVGGAVFVMWPFLTSRKSTEESPKSKMSPLVQISQLQAEREAILISVRDLDFDYQTGKLTEEDYLTQRESLMGRGVEILKQIDAEQSAAIEAAVQARRTR